LMRKTTPPTTGRLSGRESRGFTPTGNYGRQQVSDVTGLNEYIIIAMNTYALRRVLDIRCRIILVQVGLIPDDSMDC